MENPRTAKTTRKALGVRRKRVLKPKTIPNPYFVDIQREGIQVPTSLKLTQRPAVRSALRKMSKPRTMDGRLGSDERPEVRALLKATRAALPKLEGLLALCNSHWGYEDPIYRFYHQSFKVFGLQEATLKIVAALRALAPGRPLNKWFAQIVKGGTGKKFEWEQNSRWVKETAPILEAFFHARYFLEMAVRYGKEFSRPPQLLPSGWAAFLYLFDLR